MMGKSARRSWAINSDLSETSVLRTATSLALIFGRLSEELDRGLALIDDGHPAFAHFREARQMTGRCLLLSELLRELEATKPSR
jgi:hypothetical protein